MNEFTNIRTDFPGCPGLIDRLRNRDASIWSRDPRVQRSIADRLGWLDAAAFMDAHGERIDDFAERMRNAGYQQAVLLGMGGSSLAPEVYTALFGGGPRSIDLTVVDSTSPQHVRHITGQCADRSTLFIVSSKSGTTAETNALDAHFFEWARARFERPQDRFIAITDPGSPLEALARERGYRETFLNPADIGGRFSALSHFGLVPGAIAGAGLADLRAHLPDIDPGSPVAAAGCRLGMSLGDLALKGRDKLTLQLSPGLSPMAAWIEQLIDESTGKAGRGIVVIPGETQLDPDAYGPDRVFVVVELEGESCDENWIGALAEHGHPLVRWRVAGPDRLGAEFLRWEIATAAAGQALGINPFDEPDVNDTKTATRRLLAHGDGTLEATPESGGDLPGLLAAAARDDYLAVLAYLPPSADNHRRLDYWGSRLARRAGLPCTVAFGPRYLHSSGQLHKGGPDKGLFVVITPDSGDDLPIPGQSHGFGTLIRSQALGDLQVLKQRGRRVVQLQAPGSEAGLEKLLETELARLD